MRLGIGIAIIAVVTVLGSHANGQVPVPGTTFFNDLTKSINALTRNIEGNVQQLNARIRETVESNVAQARQIANDQTQSIGTGTVQIIGGSNTVISDNQGTRIVQSDKTSNGVVYVREIRDHVDADVLRHTETISYPNLNVTKVFGYTLDLKDVNAKPIPF